MIIIIIILITHPIFSLPQTTEGSLPHLPLAQLREKPRVAGSLSGLNTMITMMTRLVRFPDWLESGNLITWWLNSHDCQSVHLLKFRRSEVPGCLGRPAQFWSSRALSRRSGWPRSPCGHCPWSGRCPGHCPGPWTSSVCASVWRQRWPVLGQVEAVHLSNQLDSLTRTQSLKQWSILMILIRYDFGHISDNESSWSWWSSRSPVHPNVKMRDN